MVVELVVGAVIVVGGLWLLLSYNGFVALRNRIDNSWSQIDVQLKRRYDLVPNLLETVKGYAKHEKETFKMVTEARTAAMNAGNAAEKAGAENMLSGALKSLFAVAESYPKLRANENFLMLQEELAGIESKIAYARQFYNDTVLSFNTKTETFPDSALAGIFGFRKRDYFQIEETARSNVKVKF